MIRLLKDRFNAEGDVNLVQSNEYFDPHAIAGKQLDLLYTSVIKAVDPTNRAIQVY